MILHAIELVWRVYWSVLMGLMTILAAFTITGLVLAKIKFSSSDQADWAITGILFAILLIVTALLYL